MQPQELSLRILLALKHNTHQFTKQMNKHLTLLFAITLATLPIRAWADLGSAEQPSQLKFDAWCGKAKNNCSVIFEGNRMTVDGGGGITAQQVKQVWIDHELRGFWDRSPGNYYFPVYFVSYENQNGEIRAAKFLFINEKTGASFWNALQQFSQKTDPYGAIKQQANEAREAGSADRFNNMLEQTNQQMKDEYTRQQQTLLQMQEQRQRQEIINNLNRPIRCRSITQPNGQEITSDTTCN